MFMTFPLPASGDVSPVPVPLRRTPVKRFQRLAGRAALLDPAATTVARDFDDTYVIGPKGMGGLDRR
jgi:hypothetical protein